MFATRLNLKFPRTVNKLTLWKISISSISFNTTLSIKINYIHWNDYTIFLKSKKTILFVSLRPFTAIDDINILGGRVWKGGHPWLKSDTFLQILVEGILEDFGRFWWKYVHAKIQCVLNCVSHDRVKRK